MEDSGGRFWKIARGFRRRLTVVQARENSFNEGASIASILVHLSAAVALGRNLSKVDHSIANPGADIPTCSATRDGGKSGIPSASGFLRCVWKIGG